MTTTTDAAYKVMVEAEAWATSRRDALIRVAFELLSDAFTDDAETTRNLGPVSGDVVQLSLTVGPVDQEQDR